MSHYDDDELSWRDNIVLSIKIRFKFLKQDIPDLISKNDKMLAQLLYEIDQECLAVFREQAIEKLIEEKVNKDFLARFRALPFDKPY